MNVDMVEECCLICGITFGLTRKHRDQLINSGTSFFCPNGHRQYFTHRENMENKLEQANERADRNWESYELMKRRHSALKGVITRMKKKGE